MSPSDSRQKDILLVLVGIQLSVVAVAMPALFPLLFVAGIITVNVVLNEAIRRLDEYSGR